MSIHYPKSFFKMLSTTLPLIVSLGLLQVNALTVPKLLSPNPAFPFAADRKFRPLSKDARVSVHSHRIREAGVATAADLPSPWDPPLISDFQKDNVPAAWASGHPKVFGQEEKKWSIPNEPLPAWREAVYTEDGKFVLLTNVTDTDVINIDTGATVSTLKRKYTGFETHVSISAAPGGQYDFLVGQNDYGADGFPTNETTTQQRLSQDGTPVGAAVDRLGTIGTWFSDPTVTNSNGKRLLFTDVNFDAIVYDLDDLNSSGVRLTGHTDSVLSITISPDGKTVATTGFVSIPTVLDSTESSNGY